MRRAVFILFLGLPVSLSAAGSNLRRTSAGRAVETRVANTQTVTTLSTNLSAPQTQSPVLGNLALPQGPLTTQATQPGIPVQAAQGTVAAETRASELVETVKTSDEQADTVEAILEESSDEETPVALGAKAKKEKATKKAKEGKSFKGLRKKAKAGEDADFDGENANKDDYKSDLSPGSFGRFLAEIGQVPLLKKEEEQALGTRIQAGIKAREKQQKLEESGNVQRWQELLKTTQEERAKDDSALEKELAALEKSREVRRWKALDLKVADSRAAKDHMVRANFRLVVSIAKKFRGRGMELPDLFQEGIEGLMRAADGYDPTMGFKFSTYATWWIRQSIQRGLVDGARTVRIPAYMVEALAKLAAVRSACRRS